MIDLDSIKKYIDANAHFLLYSKEIFDVLEGELLPKVKHALHKQVLSERAFNVAVNFIPPINIVKRLVDKLTVIYQDAPIRSAENETDQMLLDYYTEDANASFGEANRFFNSMKAVAVEPFLDDRNPRIRVIPGHLCLAKASDPINPLKMTEFIKLMGEIKNDRGEKKGLVFVYSNEAFYAVDTDGKLAEGYNESNGINPVGIIPQTYIQRSRNLLVPKADSDLLQMGLLLPCMIANLNYAAHMQGHSIIYGIDIDSTNLELNPDSFWNLSSSVGGVRPELGTIKPSVDITEVMGAISAQLQLWFESRGIRPGEASGNQNSLSGISMMIKEMDATNDVKDQLKYFKAGEYDFWNKLSIQHNYWADQGMIDLPKFSLGFAPSIEFQEMKAYEDKDKIIDQQIKLVNELLTSRKRARQVVHKDLSQEDIDQIEQEIMEEIGATPEPDPIQDQAIDKV